jgi:hypothetical protein
LVSHLALKKIQEIKKAFTNVNQKSVFDNSPYLIVRNGEEERIKINHFNVQKTLSEERKPLEKVIILGNFFQLSFLNQILWH